jgi:preprotein translocase subunit YajC
VRRGNDAKIPGFCGIATHDGGFSPSHVKLPGERQMLIGNAWAQTPASGAGGGMESIFLIVAMFAVLYFLMIRPQMKRAKEHKTMVDALQKGDEVVTAGGILGRISKIGDAHLTLEVAPNVEIQVQRAAVQTVLPKGTIK